MEAGLSQRSLDIIPVAVGVGMGVPENTRRLLWERYVEGYWGDLLGGRLGAPSSELGPREQRLREKFKRLLNLLQALTLWAWWDVELRRGGAGFPTGHPQHFQCSNWVLGGHRHPRTPAHQEQLISTTSP